mmetsp:Transcript_34129/g.41274  ORF Transcript_34129/g.41274 Transcript_34129/m.41274 type:complete len:119 (+) Transcript_34129:1027-1383(+)
MHHQRETSSNDGRKWDPSPALLARTPQMCSREMRAINLRIQKHIHQQTQITSSNWQKACQEMIHPHPTLAPKTHHWTLAPALHPPTLHSTAHPPHHQQLTNNVQAEISLPAVMVQVDT